MHAEQVVSVGPRALAERESESGVICGEMPRMHASNEYTHIARVLEEAL